MRRKRRSTIIKNIESVNMEIDYDKLAEAIKSHIRPMDTTDDVLERWKELKDTAEATVEILTEVYNLYMPLFV